MTPANRGFEQSPSLFLCDVEDLRIEAEAFDSLKAKGGVSGLTTEGLESALSVLEGEADEGLEYEVSTPTDCFANAGLSFFNATAGKGTRAKDNVVLAVLDWLDDLLSFFWGSAHIGIAEENDLAVGVEYSITDGVSLAAIAGIIEESNPVPHSSSEGADDFPGAVFGTIVNDDDLAGVGLVIEIVEGFAKRPLDATFFVVCRNDDRQIGHISARER